LNPTYPIIYTYNDQAVITDNFRNSLGSKPRLFASTQHARRSRVMMTKRWIIAVAQVSS
jgi:hypothetical protein